MADITAKMVKELRERTGIAMMKCKGALQETNGNIEEAEILLRKSGEETAAKRAGRETTEGVVAVSIAADGMSGSMASVASETDFVAKNADFVQYAKDIADFVAEVGVDDFENKQWGDKTVAEKNTDMIATIGENIQIKEVVAMSEGVCGKYVHHNNKVGVLLCLNTADASVTENADVKELLTDVCQHIAFAAPKGLVREDIDEALIEAERDVYRGQMEKSGKPEQIIEKAVEGKMRRFYSENCLAEQAFVKDDKKTIAQVVEACAQKVGVELSLKSFARFQIGGEA